MKYSFKDFAEGKIATDVTQENWAKFAAMCGAAGIKCICNKRASEHDLNPFAPMSIYNKDGALLGMDTGDHARPRVPFSALFPLDPWADFCAGRCYLRVTKDEWPEFAKRCEAAGIVWQTGEKPSALMGCDDRFCLKDKGKGLRLCGYGGHYPIPTYGLTAIARPEAVKSDPNNPIPRPTVGDKFRMIRDDLPLHEGDIVRFEKDDGSHWPFFKRESDGLYTAAYFRNMEPLPNVAAPEPQPYDGRGKHKVGDTFLLLEDVNGYNKGDIVRLTRDDGSNAPEFTKDGAYPVYILYKRLKPLPPAPAFHRIEITTDGKTTTATLYEGGKAAKTGTAEEGLSFYDTAADAFNHMRYGADFTNPTVGRMKQLGEKARALADEIKSVVGESK